MTEPTSKTWKTWKTWNPGSGEPSWVKERFVDGPAVPSPGWGWELPDESSDWSGRWYRTPEKIVDEYEVEVQNPKALVALGKALGVRTYTPDPPIWVGQWEDLPAGARNVTLFESRRPLNRAGRRAQRRGTR